MAGPDGFGSSFYKKFSGILSPLLLRTISNTVEKKILPKMLYKSNISVILKRRREDLKNSEDSVPLLHLITSFGRISGLINWSE